MDLPELYDGFSVYLQSFFLQCQFYFANLVDLQYNENQWLVFMLSGLTSPACQWVELFIATRSGGLSNIAKFVGLLGKVFPSPEFNPNLK